MPEKLDFVAAVRHALQPLPARISRDIAPKRAAVALVLRLERDRQEILFIHRAENPQDPWSGHMAFPGGRMEPGDRDEQATAERETGEEINLRLSKTASLLGRLDDVQARARSESLGLAISPFVYWLHIQASLHVSAEVQDVVWIPLLHLFDPRQRQTLDYPISNQIYQLPCVPFGEKVVWGLSLTILHDLLERLAQGSMGDWIRRQLGLSPQDPLPPKLDYSIR